MREIRFRAWHKENKTMVYFDNAKVVKDQYQAHHLVKLMAGHYGDVLMQYTGLQDKNGKDIYESDLLRNESGRICVVNWHEFAGWDCEPVVIVRNDDSHGFKLNCWDRWIEKIGDIHQNPELLTKVRDRDD